MKLRKILNEIGGKEFVIWGIPPGQSDEQILFTKAKNRKEAERVMDVLTDKHGVKRARIQVIDLSKTVDFYDEFAKGIR